MKKTIYFFLVVCMAGLFAASCTSTGSSGTTANTETARPMGAEGIPMPEWVRRPPAPTADTIHFVGEGRDGKTNTAKKANARAAGLQALGDWKSGIVAAAVRDYVNEAGETGNTQSLEQLENAISARSKANTSGFREVESWIAADGTYVILFSYPSNDLRNDFKTATNEFVRNESALYAEFKADQMFQKLEENLEKE